MILLSEENAQDFLSQGLSLSVEDNLEESINYLELAVDQGLPKEDELIALKFLGSNYGDLYEDFKKTEDKILQALKIDRDNELEHFEEQDNQHPFFSKLDIAITLNSREVQEKDGKSVAIDYIKDRIANLDYLSGEYLPLSYLELGNLYAKVGNNDDAQEAWKRALQAEAKTEAGLQAQESARDNLSDSATAEKSSNKPQGSGCFAIILILVISIGLIMYVF